MNNINRFKTYNRIIINGYSFDYVKIITNQFNIFERNFTLSNIFFLYVLHMKKSTKILLVINLLVETPHRIIAKVHNPLENQNDCLVLCCWNSQDV